MGESRVSPHRSERTDARQVRPYVATFCALFVEQECIQDKISSQKM